MMTTEIVVIGTSLDHNTAMTTAVLGLLFHGWMYSVGGLLLLPTIKVITKSTKYFNSNVSSWVDQTTDSYKETIRFP